MRKLPGIAPPAAFHFGRTMQAKTIGIAGVTVPGAVDCLSKMHRLCAGRFPPLHHPRFVLDQPDFGAVHQAQDDDRWDRVADSIVGSLDRLAGAGAELAVIPANTVHLVVDDIRARSPIPLISMLDVVAEACAARGLKQVAILGTRWTMARRLYQTPLAERGITEIIPDEAQQALIQNAIFAELVPTGGASAVTVAALLEVVEAMKAQGCDGVALACTELPLVLNDANCGVPAIDTTLVLAEAALNAACV
ncbi:aspartate/glutamate racemase family protein [Chromobacterium paludis]|uniref:Aspartate/glutamate racemase family protein n=1 Tax=Chromobacterium paludis TaxID=2605945 RepID=A0A5C1DKJ4_9NEIS|nr:amino acid racemase [Chromobacterium paludis]QEL57225.1 aspartate/glutamate racemase family protein [Chromobacterium paludis]